MIPNDQEIIPFNDVLDLQSWSYKETISEIWYLLCSGLAVQNVLLCLPLFPISVKMKFTSSAAAALCLATITNACLLPEESPRFDHLQEQLILKRQANNNTGLAIGKGDRFDGGKKFPRGLGTQAPETVLGEILSLKEIESAFQGLAKEYGFETFETPHKTFEKRTVWGGKIGGAKCRDKHAAYFNAGLQ